MDDLISREELIEAILEARREETDTIPKLIRFIEKQPEVVFGDDLISREALMDDLSDNAGWDFTSRIGMIISRQPTIEPEPKRGRWIKLDMCRGIEQYKCSVCDGATYVPEVMGRPAYNFCPNCGARMEGHGAD